MIELIETFIRPLNQHGIPYIITGSVGAMVYGEPRLTNDIDVVVEIKKADIPKLIQAFPEADFYLPPADVIETELLRGSRGHFNIICQHTMLKADIYLIGSDPLQRWGMNEARTLDIDGHPITFAAPEYIIIRKLEFYREGGSEKHLRDIASMLQESSDDISIETINQRADSLHLTPHWQAAQNLTERGL